MDASALDNLIESLTNKLSSAERRVERLRADLDSATRTRDLLNGGSTSNSSQTKSSGVTVASVTREVVAELTGEFTLGDIEPAIAERMGEEDPDKIRNAISTTLSRMAKDDAVVRVRESRGQNPAVYAPKQKFAFYQPGDERRPPAPMPPPPAVPPPPKPLAVTPHQQAVPASVEAARAHMQQQRQGAPHQ